MKTINEKHNIVTVSNFPRIVPIILVATFLLLATFIATANANELNSQGPPTALEPKGSCASTFNENPQFQRGREFLNQAWIALENNNEELAVRYFARAERQFSKALAVVPDDILILMNRATAYVGLGKYESALEDFDKVLSLNSVFAPGYEGMALVYEEIGNSEKLRKCKKQRRLYTMNSAQKMRVK